MKRQTPVLVEIIGPAGAGKSTLLRELARRNPTLSFFADRLRARDPQNLPFYVGSGLALLPTLLRSQWQTQAQMREQARWYTREEISRMLYLVGMQRVFTRRSRPHGITILDQGPIFELTQLHAFGPARLCQPAFAPWWAGLFAQWAPLLALVVWLDAPDEVLIPRVRTREQAHLIKGHSDTEAHALLARYRTAFEEVMGQLQRHASPPILTFTTHRDSIEHVAERTLQEIEQVANVYRLEKSAPYATLGQTVL